MKRYLSEDVFTINDTILSWYNSLNLPVPGEDIINNLSILWQTSGKETALKTLLAQWADLQADISDKFTLINTKFDEMMGTVTALSKPAVLTGVALLSISAILFLIFLGRQKSS